MNKKVYYTVREIKKNGLGHGFYTEETTLEKNYHENEINEAIKHFRKKKSNKIIRTEIEYFDDIPYVKKNFDFGRVEDAYERKHDMESDKYYLVFHNLNIDFEM